VETAFTAGILHDIGKLALSHSLPQLHRQAIERAAFSEMTSSEAEKEVIGASHAEVGAFLLGLWGLPADIVEAVAWHHEPRLHHQEGFNALSAVHVADYVVSQSTPIWDEARKVSFDEGYVRALGLEAELERCAVMAG
jgi:putative nucleotidyltransferase with HDIG domain